MGVQADTPACFPPPHPPPPPSLHVICAPGVLDNAVPRENSGRLKSLDMTVWITCEYLKSS